MDAPGGLETGTGDGNRERQYMEDGKENDGPTHGCPQRHRSAVFPE